MIHIIEKFGPAKLPLLNLNQSENEKTTLESRLFQNTKAGKYKTEKEAIDDLYGGEKDYYKYWMLKSRLGEKLISHLHFINDRTTIFRAVQKKCFEIVHQAKSLVL